MGAMTAALYLQRAGWHVCYLGADTAIDVIRIACKRRAAQLTVISLTYVQQPRRASKLIERIGSQVVPLCPVIVGGAGATPYQDRLERNRICLIGQLEHMKQLKPEGMSRQLLETYRAGVLSA